MELPFAVYTADHAIFLQILKSVRPEAAKNENTTASFSENNVGFLNTLAPIGTTFQPAAVVSPQSRKNQTLGYTPVTRNRWFDFRDLTPRQVPNQESSTVAQPQDSYSGVNEGHKVRIEFVVPDGHTAKLLQPVE